MGYELHITRRDEWHSSDGPEISEAEWRGYVERDPELKFAGYNEPNFACFADDSDGPWLDWVDGNVDTKGPSSRMLRKMLQVAKALQAKIQGDDLEEYFEGSPDYEETLKYLLEEETKGQR
jgi:hypothetical protein